MSCYGCAMRSPLLTKRRAIDFCLIAASLCRR